MCWEPCAASGCCNAVSEMENAEHKTPRTASWFSIVGLTQEPLTLSGLECIQGPGGAAAPDSATEKTAKPYSLTAISIFDTHARRTRTMLHSVLFKVWQGQERGGSRLGGTQLLAFTTGTATPCPSASFRDEVDVSFITAAHTPQ